MATLAQVRKGQFFRIRSIPSGAAAQQAIRLGMMEGSVLQCLARIPGGPVILRIGIQEIAVGRSLACHILISEISSWKGTVRQYE